MVDEHNLVGVEQVMRNDQAADRIIGYDAPGVANNVGVAGLQAKQVLHVEPRVHARHDRHALSRLDRLLSRISGLVHRLPARVLLVVAHIPIGVRMVHDAYWARLLSWGARSARQSTPREGILRPHLLSGSGP